MSHPSKKKGWRGENSAKIELQGVGLQRIKTTGSVNYTENAPDLVQDPRDDVGWKPLLIVATQADRRPMLYTLSAPDLRNLIEAARCGMLEDIPIAVQVKKHKRFALDTLYRGLQEAVK